MKFIFANLDYTFLWWDAKKREWKSRISILNSQKWIFRPYFLELRIENCDFGLAMTLYCRYWSFHTSHEVCESDIRHESDKMEFVKLGIDGLCP